MKNIEFFPLFNDLNHESLNVDFHLHSTWTDGKHSIEEILEYAKTNGLHSIAITDHIRKESTYFDEYKKLIDLLNSKEDNFTIYSGFEAKVADFEGNIDVQESVVNKSDVAVVSVHRYPLGSNLYNGSDFKKSIAQEIELELSLAAIKKGGFNVIGHPGGMSLTFFKEFPPEFFEKIIISCKENGIAFDFNGRYHEHQVEVLYPLLKKHNPFVSIGTDSHNKFKMLNWNKLLKEIIK